MNLGPDTGWRDPSAELSGNSELRVAALIEPGRRTASVLAELERLDSQGPIRPTLFALAPHATARGCAQSATALNEAIDEAAAADVHAAALALHPTAPLTALRILRDGVDPPLPAWVSENGFELVLLPRRRRLAVGRAHPAARKLRSLGVEVRIL